jgi:hypothetical protein
MYGFQFGMGLGMVCAVLDGLGKRFRAACPFHEFLHGGRENSLRGFKHFHQSLEAHVPKPGNPS